MFGVVPKPLWERSFRADEMNRIPMVCNCILARRSELTLLVDTGYGGKCSPKQREVFCMEEGDPLVAGLAELGVGPEQVDMVVFSHLHFDHAGGGTTADPETGHIAPTFPQAGYVAHRTEWEIAMSNAPELKGAYPAENLLPLEEAGVLTLIDDNNQVLPGMSTLWTGGHTGGHQAIVLTSQGQTAVYLGDVCPTSHHLRSMWNMAYDTYPLDVRRVKPQLLGRAADEGWLCIFAHDPEVVAAHIARDEKKEFVVTETFERL